MSDILPLIHYYIPNIDQQLSDYIVAVLGSDTFSSPEDVYEAVGEVLQSCINDAFDKSNSPERDVDNICNKLFEILNVNGVQNGDEDEQKLLQPVNLSSMNAGFDNGTENWKSIWTSSKEVESKVDQKKLQKAEEKLKQKAEKRDTGVDEKVIPITNMEASASQVISKKTTKMESAGVNKTRDVKIENFDISFGSHVLLQNAEINLSKFNCFYLNFN